MTCVQLFCILLIWPLTMGATGFTTYIAVVYSSIINQVRPTVTIL